MTKNGRKCKLLKSVEKIISHTANARSIDTHEIRDLTDLEISSIKKIIPILIGMGLLQDSLTPTELGLFIIGQV